MGFEILILSCCFNTCLQLRVIILFPSRASLNVTLGAPLTIGSWQVPFLNGRAYHCSCNGSAIGTPTRSAFLQETSRHEVMRQEKQETGAKELPGGEFSPCWAGARVVVPTFPPW